MLKKKKKKIEIGCCRGNHRCLLESSWPPKRLWLGPTWLCLPGATKLLGQTLHQTFPRHPPCQPAQFLYVSLGVRWSPCSRGAWCFQLGETHRPPRQVLLCGPQHPDHHMAAPHSWVRAELRAVAVPTQPAPGRHAALQPKVPLPGETRGPAAGRRASLLALWNRQLHTFSFHLFGWVGKMVGRNVSALTLEILLITTKFLKTPAFLT